MIECQCALDLLDGDEKCRFPGYHLQSVFIRSGVGPRQLIL